MRNTFITLGLPEMLVTDNGPFFMSSEFADYIKHNAIRHVILSPYHPSSNGLAERAVQTMKDEWKKLVSGSLDMKLAQFLFKYPDCHGNFTCRADVWQTASFTTTSLTAWPSSQGAESPRLPQKFDHDRHAKRQEFKCAIPSHPQHNDTIHFLGGWINTTSPTLHTHIARNCTWVLDQRTRFGWARGIADVKVAGTHPLWHMPHSEDKSLLQKALPKSRPHCRQKSQQWPTQGLRIGD